MWSLWWHFTNSSVTGAPYNIHVRVCHTAGHCGEEYDDWNSDVFRWQRNCGSDDTERTDGRRAFHARAAATGKARSPSVVRRVDGITSVNVVALRRRRREPTSAVRWGGYSARYDGAILLRQRYATSTLLVLTTRCASSLIEHFQWPLHGLEMLCRSLPEHHYGTLRSGDRQQLGRLSQANRAAKNISAKSVHLNIALSYGVVVDNSKISQCCIDWLSKV